MKAVLVIDIDDDMIGEVDYTVMNKKEMVNGRTELRPLPPKLDANDWHRMFSGLFSEREAKGYGWNVCLDVITGETE